MLNWLRRRLLGRDRRWIPDRDERAAHEAVVQERLSRPDGAADDDDAVARHPDEGDTEPGRSA